MRFPFPRSVPVEQPPGPLRGAKLAYPMLSADGRATGFGGIWSSGHAVYRARDTAVCFWNDRHTPPKRRCSCGFYCLHSFDAARAMACDAQYRLTVILDVEVTGRFIRYEEGLRYSNQRVLGVHVNRCLCGRPASGLVDSGTGVKGWLRLQPACRPCSGTKETMPFPEFAALLGQPTVIAADTAPMADDGVDGLPDVAANPPAGDAESLSVLAAEVALLQARVDRLQEQVSRLSG